MPGKVEEPEVLAPSVSASGSMWVMLQSLLSLTMLMLLIACTVNIW
jgi:hypothetical protein